MSGDTHPNPSGSTDDGSPDDLQMQAGEYVLGTLNAAQRRSIESRLPYEPALRTAVQAWEQRLLPLVQLAPPIEPSATLWQRIAASVKPARPAVRAQRGAWWHWDSLALWRGLAGGGFAAAALLAAVLVVREASPPAAPRYFVVLAAPQNQAPGWVVQAQSEGRLRLLPLGKDAIPAEKSLQFWTKVVNIALMPILVALFGVGVALIRRRRVRAT